LEVFNLSQKKTHLETYTPSGMPLSANGMISHQQTKKKVFNKTGNSFMSTNHHINIPNEIYRPMVNGVVGVGGELFVQTDHGTSHQ